MSLNHANIKNFFLFTHLGPSIRRKGKKKKHQSDKQSTTSSRISTNSIEKIIDRLKTEKYRESTKDNYYRVWKLFNQFFIRLDRKPEHWDERLILFIGYLIDSKRQSSTVKSYISAIRAVLQDNGIKLKNDQYLITSLIKACRLNNDKVHNRLPIQKSMLEVILRKVKNYYNKRNQPYLRDLYRCLFSTMYYGLFRIGKLTQSKHVVKARDVHLGKNKRKFLFVLHSSKTHCRGSKPQQIKVCRSPKKEKQRSRNKQHFNRKRELPCPYGLLKKFLKIRGKYKRINEQFFVFTDKSSVKPFHLRKCLKKMLKLSSFDYHKLFGSQPKSREKL